jgi:hypothetical protein
MLTEFNPGSLEASADLSVPKDLSEPVDLAALVDLSAQVDRLVRRQMQVDHSQGVQAQSGTSVHLETLAVSQVETTLAAQLDKPWVASQMWFNQLSTQWEIPCRLHPMLSEILSELLLDCSEESSKAAQRRLVMLQTPSVMSLMPPDQLPEMS